MKTRISVLVGAVALLFACGGANLSLNNSGKNDVGFSATPGSGGILYGHATTQNPTPLGLLGPLGVPMPSSGTVQNLYAVSDPPLTTAGATVTISVNGVDSALSCEFDNQGRCVNTSVQISVTTGQRVQGWLRYPVQTSPYPVVALAVEKK
jgi:hypothetical protein